jgi:hypothetical protein
MGTNPLNPSSLKEALPLLGLGNGDVPDPKELTKDIKGGTYQTLTIKSAYGPDGKLDFSKLQKGIAAYQLGHEKKRSLANSLVNLGALWGGVQLLLANQQELLKEETSSLPVAQRQLQKILNAPANLINKGAQP